VYSNEEGSCKTPTWAATASGVLCVVAFAWYLIDQYRARETNEIIDEKIKTTSLQALAQRLITARTLLAPPAEGDFGALRASSASGVYEARTGARAASQLANGGAAAAGAEEEDDITVSVPLMRSASGNQVMPAEEASGRAIIRSVFARYDRDRSGHIDERELGMLLADLGESSRAEDVRALMEAADTDRDGVLSFSELYAVLKQHADANTGLGSQARPSAALRTNGSAALTAGEQEGAEKEEESDEDDAEEVPEDLADLPPEEQRRRVIRRSLWTMGIGTLAVLIFSDPMVDVISEVGNRTGIKPFYVAFIFAPLISNGSELIAAYAYAGKKSERSMTISLATLLGAACMNNTFCLSIFLFIVAAKRLKWVFTAEITAIVAVEILMAAIMLLNRRSLKLWWMFVVAALFPLSLALVAGMEAAGLD
jgi:Ca2+/Na+ antiporter